jgi:hypothetical protein
MPVPFRQITGVMSHKIFCRDRDIYYVGYKCTFIFTRADILQPTQRKKFGRLITQPSAKVPEFSLEIQLRFFYFTLTDS